MIGPGWMPSRPRPLGQGRRGLFSYTSRYKKRRPPRQRSAPGPRIVRDAANPGCNTELMLFDGPADLPTATLRSRASEARHRVLAADLHGWLANRWSWVRPRTVPLLVAFAGMLAILGATKYLSVYAYNDDLRLRAPAGITNFGGDVASNNPALPGLATSRLQPASDGNAVVPPLDSDQVHGHERRGHGRCSHVYRIPSAELTAEPPPPGSPGELTPGRSASRR
jgi:hypothetical protein